MNIKHSACLPLHTNPLRIDPVVCPLCVALPLTKNVIGLWRISKDTVEKIPIELEGHTSSVNVISVGNGPGNFLVSSCQDKVILWKIKDICARNDVRNISASTSASSDLCDTVFTQPGTASAICLDNSDELIAVGTDAKIKILRSKQNKPVAIFEVFVHSAMITGLAFCPHYSATLVSISDDRSFSVWDVSKLQLVYHSAVLGSAPLISLCMNWSDAHVAIGAADGMLRIFDLADGNDFRLLSKTNIASHVNKCLERQTVSKSEPSDTITVTKRGQETKIPSQNDLPMAIESSESVLSIQYAYSKQVAKDNSTMLLKNLKSAAGDVIDQSYPNLCIMTTNSLVQLNSRTYEVTGFWNWQQSVSSESFQSEITVGPVSFASAGQVGQRHMVAVVGTVFDRKMHFVQWTIENDAPEMCDSALLNETETLNVIAVNELLESSPLRAEMSVPSLQAVTTKGDIATGKKKSTDAMNQPLTFKSKIKSSGYSQAPRTTRFKPETSKAKLLPQLSERAKQTVSEGKSSFGKLTRSDYDTNSGPPSTNCDSFIVDQHQSAIFNLRFSDDGSGLAAALSNKSAINFKSPLSKHMSTSYVGHNLAVNSVYWSNSSCYLLTASSDKTVALWDKTGGDPLMTLSHRGGNPSSAGQQSQKQKDVKKTASDSRTENKPFTKDLKHAQFFYRDRFILVLHGSELLLYKYCLSPDKDEIKRYQSRNRYKLVTNWQTSSSSFTAMAAVNSFYSHLVMTATSERNLEIYDLNSSMLAHSFEDSHARPPHCIAMNEGSCYASQQSQAYNVIATIALTDPVKLWDVRSKSCVQSLQGHVNSAHSSCQIAFSPCGNYLACGSEDRAAYVYDLRTGTYCARLKGHTEVVTSVAFHPAQPLLATGSLNSKILLFKPE